MSNQLTPSLSASQAPSYPFPEHDEQPAAKHRGHLRVHSKPVSKSDVAVLGQQITLPFSGRVVKNRFMKAPMTERVSAWAGEGEDISARGVPTPEYNKLYEEWGRGGIGLIVSGNIMIKYDAVEAFGNPILQDNHDGRVEKFREMTKLAKAHGSLVVAQLSHPGRQGGKALNPNPVSASDVQLTVKWAGNEFAKPRALTIPEIKDLVKMFGETAYLCHQAGFDGVEVHAAHGYLIAQMLSPSTNQRTDEYGGSLENRSRFLIEIIEEIHRRVNDSTFIIGVKVNSVEFQNKGLTQEDARDLCISLEQARVDFVDLSGGTFEGRAFHHVKESTKNREAYFIEFADVVRPYLKKTRVWITGGFRSVGGMVDAVRGGSCDGVGLARPLSAEPHLCKDILKGDVTGAIDSFVPLPMNTQASGTQLLQIAKGDELISDFSVEEEVQRWIKANEVETARKISLLPKVDSSGFPYLEAEAGFAYKQKGKGKHAGFMDNIRHKLGIKDEHGSTPVAKTGVAVGTYEVAGQRSTVT